MRKERSSQILHILESGDDHLAVAFAYIGIGSSVKHKALISNMCVDPDTEIWISDGVIQITHAGQYGHTVINDVPYGSSNEYRVRAMRQHPIALHIRDEWTVIDASQTNGQITHHRLLVKGPDEALHECRVFDPNTISVA